jgi:hypothetical protein
VAATGADFLVLLLPHFIACRRFWRGVCCCVCLWLCAAAQVVYRCPTGSTRNKLVREVGVRPTSQTMFKLDDGKEVSVAQYFAGTYQ